MALSYAEQKLLEALRLNQDNKSAAGKQVREMLFEDHKFLMELTWPYLTGIIAHGFGRVEDKMRAGADINGTQDELELGDLSLSASDNNQSQTMSERMGKELLKTFAAQDTAKFGLEHGNRTPPLRRKAASQNHVDAIHLMVAKSKSK